MAVPRYDELFIPVLRVLADGNEHTTKELVAAVVREVGLSEEETEERLPSGRQTVIANRVGWARTYLKFAGLVAYPRRGVYVITDEGIKALKSGATIDQAYLGQFESFREWMDRSQNGQKLTESDTSFAVAETDITPDEALVNAYRLINDQLIDELIEEVLKLSPSAFEKFVLDLMNAMGYGSMGGDTEVTPMSNDEGIDGIIMQDKLGFNRIYVQAKHYAQNHMVGRPEIQAFVGAIAGRDGRGLFVTTSQFTQQAKEYADRQHIVVVDGRKLAELMIGSGFGVTTRKVYEVKTLDTDLFEEYTKA